MMQAMGYSIEEAQGLYNGRGMLAPFDAMYSPAQKRALFEDPECGKVFRRPGLGCDEKVEVPEQDSHMFEDDKKKSSTFLFLRNMILMRMTKLRKKRTKN